MFFSTPRTAAEGAGAFNNQVFCLGCHMNTAEGFSPGLLSPKSCIAGSTCVSLLARAGRSSLTNFSFTSLDPATGGGRPADNLDAIHNTGRTAAFTTFGDFNPSPNVPPAGIGFFDPLDGAASNPVTGTTSQPLGGFVQHTRPAPAACVPDPIPPVKFDTNLTRSIGFRRSVGERAGPPYIARGLLEAIPTADILANADPDDTKGHNSSLGNFAKELGCKTDCISGRPNMIPRTLVFNRDAKGNLTSVTGFAGGVGRFGLRANGMELLQFVIGGLQGEIGFTTLINSAEVNLPTLFPNKGPTSEPAACIKARAQQQSNAPELHLSSPFSIRNLLRSSAPPEFGDALLDVLEDVLESPDRAKPRRAWSEEARVQRGAELFGIDLKAFANRMIPGRFPAAGDGLDPNAINQADRKLNCAGCHTPISRTGQSPAEVGANHLSFVWAPIFSDLLLHKMPVINAERFAQRPRDPLVISRLSANGVRVADTFDLPRNLADDTFNAQKALADGREFRTPPLMGLGRIGPPFLHDGRVYLSNLTVDDAPAGTVTTNRRVTNAPLVVRSLDDALRAAIELHDLPAPDGRQRREEEWPQTRGAGCPVPPKASNVSYGSSPQDVICPPYASATSRTNRSDSREVMRRWHGLSPEDQQAVIEFLKQL